MAERGRHIARRALVDDHDVRLWRAARTFRGATALEPGGPTWIFRRGGLIPVYPQLAALNTLDFASATIWTGDNHDWVTIRHEFVGEAADPPVDVGSYDVILASHVIEHIANPIGALRSWSRLVKPGGRILLVVPHYEGSFDHRRTVTTVTHLLADAQNDTGEDDTTHIEEAIAHFDPQRDPEGAELFEQRARMNHVTRVAHHHVFDSLTTATMCEAAGLTVAMLRPKRPYHIVCLCSIGDTDGPPVNLRKALHHSPFASDHR